MPAAIEVDGLRKCFGDLVAVDGVRFDVPAASVFGFLGPNGSGKTTTLGMLTGLIPPDAGAARILGHDVERDLDGALAATGAMIEEPAFYAHLSGRRNLRLLAPLVGADGDDVERVLARMGLADRGDDRYGGYSQGMRRRLGLAAALLGDPDVLVVDEPTNGLDPAGQREVRRLLRELAGEGRTVLLSSHQMAEVQDVCTDVAILHRGRIVEQGAMQDVLQTKEVLEVEVDDPRRARAVLAGLAEVLDVASDGRLRLHAARDDAAAINQTLVGHGIEVRELVHRGAMLEERFLELTGDGAPEDLP